MDWTLDRATLWTERLIAIALFLQTVELLQSRRAFWDDGIWSFELLNREHDTLPTPLRWLLALLLPYRPFVALLALQLTGAALLALGVSAVAPALLLTDLTICARFRGTFNGGSDSMTVLVLLALSLAWLLAPFEVAASACLGYIAVQVTLSYFISGVAKLKEPSWRDGSALRAFVTSQRYGAPPWIRQFLDGHLRCKALSWALLAFECGFPLAWIHPLACTTLIALGMVFHLGNWLLFGLNRFLFAWSAAYPALLYASHLLSSAP
jgi:hypothetical protein